MVRSRRELEDAELLEQIVKVRSVGEYAVTYGSPRVWLELRRQGVHVGRKRVERIMREHGLVGAHLRRGCKHGSTRQDPNHTAAGDRVERDFHAHAPNRLWVADLTRFVTGEGVLWLASVRDAFANRVVGWATSERATTTLVLTALNYALRSRDVRAGELIHHSDKGAQYTALRFTRRLADAEIAPSTGSTGDSYDTQSTIVGEGVVSELARHTSGREVRYPGGMMVLDAVSGSDPSYDRPLGADALICRLRGGVPRRDRGYARVTR